MGAVRWATEAGQRMWERRWRLQQYGTKRSGGQNGKGRRGTRLIVGPYWEISLPDYIALASAPCTWCEWPAEWRDQAVGLDRLDERLGYVIGNVVPSCWPCNRVRGSDRNGNGTCCFSPEAMLTELGPAILRWHLREYLDKLARSGVR